MSAQLPSVGRIVHYVSYGTAGGEFPSTCRAAVVTATDKYVPAEESATSPEFVDLAVLNPEGMFFNRDVSHFEDGTIGGTWHWPERVGG
jgi:hypothetical protein